MILWLNGAFGVGKTTTARAIRERAPTWRSFDPEQVGMLLAANLAWVEFNDFQDLPPWRSLVPAVASEVSEFTGDDLVVVQTVLVRSIGMRCRRGLENANKGLSTSFWTPPRRCWRRESGRIR